MAQSTNSRTAECERIRTTEKLSSSHSGSLRADPVQKGCHPALPSQNASNNRQADTGDHRDGRKSAQGKHDDFVFCTTVHIKLRSFGAKRPNRLKSFRKWVVPSSCACLNNKLPALPSHHSGSGMARRLHRSGGARTRPGTPGMRRWVDLAPASPAPSPARLQRVGPFHAYTPSSNAR